MPTGYTAGVKDGSVTDFREFVLQCARAFGATITMRDDPMDAPIPDAFEPSDYHAKALAEAQAQLTRVTAMTDRDVAREADSEYEKASEGWRKHQQEQRAERERYERMLAAATAWQPPTPEHQGLKDFMCSQLTESIKFDCGGDWWKEPVRQTEAQWRSAALERAQHNVAYHGKEHAAEVERAKTRTEWVRALRASL